MSRPRASDAAHSDHMSITDNDVMQVAMSGHLLLEPRLDEALSRSATLDDATDRLSEPEEPEEPKEQEVTVQYVPDEYQSKSVSNLEQYFDQRFQDFALPAMRSVDWSLSDADPSNEEPQGREYDDADDAEYADYYVPDSLGTERQTTRDDPPLDDASIEV